jgi:hypothetical protein
MSDYLIQVSLPNTFFKKQFPVSGEELAFGFEKGWVSGTDVVDVLAWWWKQGQLLSPADEEIASLSPNNLWQLPELLEKCQRQNVEKNNPRIGHLWMYLIVAWLFENISTFPDPLGEIEKVYADFEYPDEIQSLVRYMPAQEGQPVGEKAIISRWGEYVRRVKAEFLAERKRATREEIN